MTGRGPCGRRNRTAKRQSDEVGRSARAVSAGGTKIGPGNDRGLRRFIRTLRMKDDDGARSTHCRQQRCEGKAFRADLAGGAGAREIRLVSQVRIAVGQCADLRKQQRER